MITADIHLQGGKKKEEKDNWLRRSYIKRQSAFPALLAKAQLGALIIKSVFKGKAGRKVN